MEDQTNKAFKIIEDSLLGKIEDNLDEVILKLELLLYRAKKIKNTCASSNYSSDYDDARPFFPYCDLPN
jgi:hypothetical protein